MRIWRNLCVVAALVLPQLMLAKLPFSNDAFGKVEGTLDFCIRVDPPAAPKYRERKKLLLRNVPEKEVDEARKTREYKDAYDGITAELAKVPEDQAIKACRDSLDGK